MNQLEWEKKHYRRIAGYSKQIDAIFSEATREAAAIGSLFDANDLFSKPFSFKDYPATTARVNKMMERVHQGITTVVVNGATAEWNNSNLKNDEIAMRVLGIKEKGDIPGKFKKYFNNNGPALKAFLERKEKGLNLSDRVWKYTNGFKKEIELGLDTGIRAGKPASEMARDLKQYLKEPNKLFRRVRDQHGNLQLSKAAKAYNPGRGVYRSSYKNAMRLTRTETNMAYRAADHTRMQQLDFVVGIEVRLTNNPAHVYDICDELKGRYPKDFKFVGWHPHCMCHAITILKTPDELNQDIDRIQEGKPTTSDSQNKVEGLPQNFKEWAERNKDRIATAKSQPYFIRDNANAVKLILSKKNAFDVDIAGIINAKTDIEASNELLDFLTKNGVEWKDMGKYMSQPDKKAALINAYDEFNNIGEYYNVNKYQYESISKRQKLIEGDLLQATNSDYGYISTVNYKEINGKLRGVNEFSLYQAEKAQTIKSLDRMIDSNKLPENMMLYRNVDNDFIESIFKVDKSAPIDDRLLKIQESIDNGVIISDKGFCSTSCISDMNVFGQRDVFITIKAPKGTNAFVTSNFDESEVILKRGQKFRVTKVTKTTREYRVAARTINKEIIQIELVAL